MSSFEARTPAFRSAPTARRAEFVEQPRARRSAAVDETAPLVDAAPELDEAELARRVEQAFASGRAEGLREGEARAVHETKRALAALAEGIATMEAKPVLHGDNGSTLGIGSGILLTSTAVAGPLSSSSPEGGRSRLGCEPQAASVRPSPASSSVRPIGKRLMVGWPPARPCRLRVHGSTGRPPSRIAASGCTW